ncbi:MAG: chorismate transformation enzyme, FkbO/Hyg5 family, partial [Gammaproteobacteria bacterium]
MSRASVELDRLPAGPCGDRNLAISLGSEIGAAAADHNLLAAFHFGTPRRGMPDTVFSTGLVPIDGNDQYECWWYNGGVMHRTIGDIRIAECDDYAVVTLRRPDVPAGEIRALTYECYLDLLSAIGSTEHAHIAKIWNYFPDINDGDGDGEKYRQFSMGRAEAFEQAGLNDSAVPCGTAVGGPDGGDLAIVALASKHDFLPTENPRQVSAYVYPRQYGPRSPKFSRGGCVSGPDHCLFVLSGTAAIVGHESAHPYQTPRQINETLENLTHLGS